MDYVRWKGKRWMFIPQQKVYAACDDWNDVRTGPLPGAERECDILSKKLTERFGVRVMVDVKPTRYAVWGAPADGCKVELDPEAVTNLVQELGIPFKRISTCKLRVLVWF